jgi:phage-related protein
MKGVKFGNYHSYYEWGLILSSKEIQSPEPKVNQIEIEGSDGVLDLTDFFGGVKYKNRSLSFTFSKMDIVPDGFLALYSLVQDLLHGKKMQVILDDDPNHFYYGRVTINEWKSNKNIGEIVIEVDAEPFKQEMYETVVRQTVSSNANIVLANSKMPVVPTITTTSEFLISFGGYNDSYSAGTFTIPELELGEGDNNIYVEGTGTITFSYRKGRL